MFLPLAGTCIFFLSTTTTHLKRVNDNNYRCACDHVFMMHSEAPRQNLLQGVHTELKECKKKKNAVLPERTQKFRIWWSGYMACTYIALAHTFKLPQSTTQLPLNNLFTHTLRHQWVTAVHIRHCQPHWKQFRAKCRAPGHNRRGWCRIWTANLSAIGPPTLLPELQSPYAW